MEAVKNKGVDTHAHVFSAHAPAVPGARYRPAYASEASAWRSQWAGAGITHGVVVQPSFFGADNRELLDTIASDSTNLRGVRDYAEYASRSWRALYSRIHELGWHVECFIDTGRLRDIAGAFDGTPVAVAFDHFGAPGRDDASVKSTFAAVASMSRDREVWCKCSAPYRLEGDGAKDHAKRWLDAVGPARLVWGSDWPCTGFESEQDYAKLRATLDEWADAALARAVLWDNAARLYGFE